MRRWLFGRTSHARPAKYPRAHEGKGKGAEEKTWPTCRKGGRTKGLRNARRHSQLPVHKKFDIVVGHGTLWAFGLELRDGLLVSELIELPQGFPAGLG